MKSKIVSAVFFVLIFLIGKDVTISGIFNLIIFALLILISFVAAAYSSKGFVGISEAKNSREQGGEILGLIIFLVVFYITFQLSVVVVEFIGESINSLFE